MDIKNITLEELIEYSKKVYADACFGHFDLMESYTQKEAEKFFHSLKNANPLVVSSIQNSDMKTIDLITQSTPTNLMNINAIYHGGITTITSSTSDFI